MGERLRGLQEAVRRRLAILRPLWLPGSIVILVSLALLPPQSQDVLADLSERRGLEYWSLNLRFSLCLATFALCAWFFSRVLLRSSFPAVPRDAQSRLVRWRLMTPWALGLLPLLTATLSAALRGAGLLVLQFGATFGVIAVLLGMRLRTIGPRLQSDVEFRRRVVPERTRLSGAARLLLAGILLVSLVLLAAFLVSPVRAPQQVGALGVLLLAGTGWVAFSSIVLVYPTYRFDLPSLAGLAVVYAVLCSPFNDNHDLRRTEHMAPVEGRPGAQEHFTAWSDSLKQRWTDRWGKVDGPLPPCPVFVVAAEGGGIRAAYWTAGVLAFLEDEIPGFSEHVFAISGVSGGSLGAAAFVAALADRDAGVAPADTGPEEGPEEGPGLLGRRVREMLGQDFLAPVLGGMVTRDFTQIFLPFSLLPDRAASLELAWEQAWTSTAGTERFSQDFLGLWTGDGAPRRPSLLLNGTWVESGGRHLTSNLRVDAQAFGRAEDVLSLLNTAIPLSTAVHNSARFTLISPAGIVPPDMQSDEVSDRRERRIVDGGYFENSGALTARQLVRIIQPRAGGMQIHVLLLLNSPEHLRANPPPPPSWLVQVMAPVRAMLGTRSARGLLAIAETESTLTPRSGTPAPRTFEFKLPLLGERSAPLGWMLAASTRTAIDRAIEDLRGEVRASSEQILETQSAGLLELIEPALRANHAAQGDVRSMLDPSKGR